MVLSASDKASCNVMTWVPSLETTVTDLGALLPVRCCSKAMVAFTMCWTMVVLDLLIEIVPSGHRSARPKAKKADVVGHLEVFNHVGLLVNEPPGTAELPFT
jgi:hypothetical protein